MESSKKQFKELPLVDRLCIIAFSMLVLMCVSLVCYLVFSTVFSVNPL